MPKGLETGRTGFTTGACAAAAAKAATRFLVRNQVLDRIDSTLPNKQKITFLLKRCERMGDQAVASVIKDAGDDPDCTHGAEMIATVSLKKEPGVDLIHGEGVGVVTKPGLGLEIGILSITAVPRKNITEMVLEELTPDCGYRGARIILSVPGGEEMAKKTTNAKLGIVGGISILGTTGIVHPYSTSAFMASVVQEVDVAHALGIRELAMTTGGKSEEFAKNLFSAFPEEGFIQVGDFIGVGLKSAARKKMERVHIVGMMGKLSKMANGKMQTHVAGSQVNMELLSRLAKEAGASDELYHQISLANTARHALELAASENILNITSLVCREVCKVAENHVSGAVRVSTYLFDFDGKLLAQYPEKGA